MTRALKPPEWTKDALCAQIDPDFWFPEQGEPTKAPKRVCMVCPVRVECLEYSIDHKIPNGIWGGLSALERRRLIS